jgi:hypothetical protein
MKDIDLTQINITILRNYSGGPTRESAKILNFFFYSADTNRRERAYLDDVQILLRRCSRAYQLFSVQSVNGSGIRKSTSFLAYKFTARNASCSG